MNSIQIEEIERYLEEIPDDGDIVSEFEDSDLDEFDINHPLDKVEHSEEFDIQNLDVVFDNNLPTADEIELSSDEEYAPKKTKNKGKKKQLKKSKMIVAKPKSKNTVRTLEDVEAEEEDQTDNLRPRIYLRKTDMDTVRPEYCRPEGDYQRRRKFSSNF